jgi:hypothetical protein
MKYNPVTAPLKDENPEFNLEIVKLSIFNDNSSAAI